MIIINTREHFERNIVPFFNLKEYWDKGYKGQDIVVASVEDSTSEHGNNVMNTILTYAPNVTFLSYNDTHEISATAEHNEIANFPNFVDWCIENKVDIVTSSLGWTCNQESEKQAIKKLYDNGIIFCNAIGNDGRDVSRSAINQTYSFGEEIISVGGIRFSTNNKITYSPYNYGECVDVCGIACSCPTLDENGIIYVWSGTSVATPFVAGLLALYKSYDKTLNSKNVFDKIINKLDVICEYKGYNHKVMILPKIGDDVKVNNEDWKKEFDEVWKKATELKIVDGTRPNEPITRNELIVILSRIGLLK